MTTFKQETLSWLNTIALWLICLAALPFLLICDGGVRGLSWSGHRILNALQWLATWLELDLDGISVEEGE